MPLAIVAGATANGPEEGTGKVRITVAPSDGLPATATVQVSGTGFKPLHGVELLQCSRLPGTTQWRASGPQQVSCGNTTVETMTDANGDFGPVNLEVSRTFQGFSGRGPSAGPTTYTCLADNDCVVYATPFIGAPNTVAWHHLTFAA